MLSPLCLHLPHASSVVPEGLRGDFLVGAAELASEQLRLEDRYTDELFGAGWPAAQTWRAPVSRLVVDVERFRADDREPCAAVGMGAVYVRGTRGQALRRPDPERREVLLKTYYDPHHRACQSLHLRISFGDHRHNLTRTCLHFLNIAEYFFVGTILCGNKDHWHLLVNQGDRTVLHFCSRITLRVDVGDLLQLQGPFQGYGEVVPSA
mgnify:CR=1 FL=1